MAINEIIKEIDAEIARLQQVRRLLSQTPAASVGLATRKSSTPKKASRGKRTLSAEARQRIADAQRKRWAAAKAKK
jgi:hypothetical protein